MLSEQDVRNVESVRHARKITVGRGLYLFVTPEGGRSWKYKFYFAGKCKKLMLGTYPEISLECAKSRHQYARNVLAQGTNPCEMKATLGKNEFVRRMRDWEIVEYPRQECSPEERWLGFKVVAPQAREVANCLTFWTAVSVRNRWAPVILAVHVHDKA